MKKQTIEKLRSEVDQIDEQIIRLLSDRMEKVKKIGEIKNKIGKSKLDITRFNKLLKKRIELGERYELSKDLITKIWNLIHDEALRIEEKIK